MGLLSNPRFGELLDKLTENPEESRSGDHPPRPPRTPRTLHPHRLKREEVDELVQLYWIGCTVKELSEHYRIHRDTVSQHLSRRGVQRREGMSREQIKTAIELYEQGWSLARIGKHLGVWPSSVYYRLKQVGTSLRKR